MLKVLRDNLKYLSWILWAVIAIFVLFVFVDFGSFAPGANGPTGTAASFGHQKISFEEFERLYKQTTAQYQRALGEQFNDEMVKRMGLPFQVLDQLINERILADEARRMGLVATDEEVRQAILEIPAFKGPDGQFIGDQTYDQVLRAYGYRVSDFETSMRRDVLTNKLRAILAENLYVSDSEVEKAYRDQVERAKIRYVLLPFSRFEAEASASIVPADLESYFSAHKELFRLPEQRVVSYLLVETAKLRDGVTLGEGELRKAYDEHRDQYTRPEEVQARHILVMVNDKRTADAAEKVIDAAKKRIEGGEDFAKVAREVSEDPGSKGSGGELGWFGHGRMVKEFEQAAFDAVPGKLVGPVRSPFGFHLIEVENRRAGGEQPFEEVKDQVRARLTTERSQAAAEALAKRLGQQIKDDKLTSDADLAKLADTEPAVGFATTLPFGRNDSVPGIGRAPAFGEAAFALVTGALSEPVQVARGWAILHVDEVKAPRVPELSEVQGRVRQAVLKQKEGEIASRRLAEARGTIEGGKSLDQVAGELGVTATESQEFGHGGAISGLGSSPALVDAAMALSENQVGGPVEVSQGVVLFQVAERKHFDPATFAQAKEQTREGLRQQKLSQLLGALVERRRRELDVQYDRQLLQSFGLLDQAKT